MEYDDLVLLVKHLESRVDLLEEENVSLTNELYRLENSLDARIDILAGTTVNLTKFELGEK